MLSKESEKSLKLFSKQIQIETIKMIAHLGKGHVGGAFSISDLLAVLYGKQMKYDPANPKWADRDWLVLSKGHAGPALYSALALKGFMPLSELTTLNRPGTNLPSHCDRLKTPGIDMTTGSLGQGASSAAGIALAHKMNHAKNHVFLVLGDGESNEGQVWEMALFAASKKLSNLIAFLDYNKLQLDGPTKDICDLGDAGAKFREFGWYVQDIDGHDVAAIDNAIDNAKRQTEKPSMIVLETVKAHGWKEMENTSGSHCPAVSEDQLKQALSELNAAKQEIEKEDEAK